MNEIEGVKLALALNHEELATRPSEFGLGSYLFREEMIQFVTFIPNLVYLTGLLPALVDSCAIRAKNMSRMLPEHYSMHEPTGKIRCQPTVQSFQGAPPGEKQLKMHAASSVNNRGM